MAQLRVEVECLRLALLTRTVLEQAKGIVMATNRCGADEALQLLVIRSQRNRRKLREVAAELVTAHDCARRGRRIDARATARSSDTAAEVTTGARAIAAPA